MNSIRTDSEDATKGSIGFREGELFLSSIRTKIFYRVLLKLGRKALHDLDENSRNAERLSKELLFKLLEENKDTEYGKKYDFANIHSVEEYKQKVPYSSYDDYEPYIRRMVKNGEKNLISSAEPKHYALSSGTVGVPKHIPVSQAELDKYSKYGTAMLFGVANEYYKNTKGRGLSGAKGLNNIELKLMETELGVPKGAITGTLLKPIKKYINHLQAAPWEVCCPPTEINGKYFKSLFALSVRDLNFFDSAFMTGLVDIMDYIRDNWEMLCSDIEQGRINESMDIPDELRKTLEDMLGADKDRADELRREFEKGFDTPIIPRIWPNLRFIGAIGTGGFFTYVKKMRRYSGKNIPFINLCYAASESFMAVARRTGDEYFVLIPEGGFYEFIPMNQDDENLTLTIDQLEVGEDYEIVITNLSGFYRYRIKDVVRVTGFYNESPLIQFVYRKSQMLSIAGEKTNEEAVRWSIGQFMKETGVRVSDYSIYGDLDTKPGHYVLFMEPDQVILPEDVEKYREVIEEKLMQANPSYGEKIRTGILGKTELIFVQQQTYQLYRDMMIMKGVSQNQLKPVRVIDTPMKLKFFYGLRERY